MEYNPTSAATPFMSSRCRSNDVVKLFPVSFRSGPGPRRPSRRPKAEEVLVSLESFDLEPKLSCAATAQVQLASQTPHASSETSEPPLLSSLVSDLGTPQSLQPHRQPQPPNPKSPNTAPIRRFSPGPRKCPVWSPPAVRGDLPTLHGRLVRVFRNSRDGGPGKFEKASHGWMSCQAFQRN